ncbi:MAG: hypothetical protein EOP04_14370 [Proteobacteria bacterium]|nr:MAG: hypothetical protein EOP04_14370 [Pseudomonadota bacterium]
MRIVKTWIIILEVDKLKQKFLDNIHKGDAERIFDFLDLAVEHIRSDGTLSLSSVIRSLIFAYPPHSKKNLLSFDSKMENKALKSVSA